MALFFFVVLSQSVSTLFFAVYRNEFVIILNVFILIVFVILYGYLMILYRRETNTWKWFLFQHVVTKSEVITNENVSVNVENKKQSHFFLRNTDCFIRF